MIFFVCFIKDLKLTILHACDFFVIMQYCVSLCMNMNAHTVTHISSTTYCKANQLVGEKNLFGCKTNGANKSYRLPPMLKCKYFNKKCNIFFSWFQPAHTNEPAVCRCNYTEIFTQLPYFIQVSRHSAASQLISTLNMRNS